jgi:hypothetical protein
MWIRILTGAPVITQIRPPEGSCVVLIGRHGAMNPAGRVRCDMLDLSVPVAQPFGGLERGQSSAPQFAPGTGPLPGELARCTQAKESLGGARFRNLRLTTGKLGKPQ